MTTTRKPKTLGLPSKPASEPSEPTVGAPEGGPIRRKNLVGDRTRRRSSAPAPKPAPASSPAATSPAAATVRTSRPPSPSSKGPRSGPRTTSRAAFPAKNVSADDRHKGSATGSSSTQARRPRPENPAAANGGTAGGAAGSSFRNREPRPPRDRAPDAANRRTTGDKPFRPSPQGAERTAPPTSPPARFTRTRPVRPPTEATSAKAQPADSVVRKAPADGKVRISKLLSERGLCSRREADEFIERGWVLVDGQPVTELGTRVHPDQTVSLARDARAAQLRSVTFLLNKPIGYVSGTPEPGKKPAMTLLVPDNRWDEDSRGQRFEPAHLRGLAPAGRLDIDSTGLIVFTQDGRVARRLIGEDSTVEKEYLVRVEGQIQDNGLKLLNHGLSLDGQKLKPAKVSWQNEEQLRFVLREGRKRQIRRMCELVGLKVVGLKRIRIGSVLLGKLPPGKWRYLRDDERF